MLHSIIILRSLTYAQRAERLLERAGIYASVKKVPQSASPEGCTYGVLVRSKNLDQAQSTLIKNSMTIRNVLEYNIEDGTVNDIS